MRLKKQYEGKNVSVKVKDRTVKINTALLTKKDIERFSKSEHFSFLFESSETPQVEEVNENPELFPEFDEQDLKAMSKQALKEIYHFVTASNKPAIIKEILDLNYGNPIEEVESSEEI